MDHNMVLSYEWCQTKYWRQRANVPLLQTTWRSSGGVKTKHVALPDAACPGLHRKPLDAAIRQLLALYCPCGRHGDNQPNNDAKCTFFAGSIPRASLDGGGLWLSLKPLNAAIGLALAPILSIGHANAGWFLHFIVKKGSSWHVGP